MLKQIYPAFVLSLIVVLFGSVFFSTIRIFAFAPFLALVLMRLNFLKSLWIAAIIGMIIDLLSVETRFGMYSVIYSLTVLLIYRQKKHFFADKPLALALYTAVISITSGSIELSFLYVFGTKMQVNLPLILCDVFALSLLDALYAFLCFTCPIQVYQYLQRVRDRFKKRPEDG